MKNQSIKNTVRFLFVAVILCLLSFQALGDEVLNNSSIIDLQKIGLSEATIIQKINTSKCNFDTSVSGLKQLKAANVPDNVIQTMMSGGATSVPATGASVVAVSDVKPLITGDVNNPNASHELGIWLCQIDGGKTRMTEMEPAMFGAMKTGSGWGLGWGGSMHTRVALNGPKATLQLTERKPVFYIYFGESTLNGATSPSEFTLVKTEVKKDHDVESRMIVTGKINAYSGSSMGFDEKAVIAFDFEKIAKGAYKVTPKADLADGEYCFCQGSFAGVAAGGAAGKVYDFGVAGAASK